VHRYEPLDFDCAGAGEARVDWESGFRLNDQRIAEGLGAALAPRLSDLLDLAMAAYVTDRLRPRRPPGTPRSAEPWARRLPVRLAVRDIEFWCRSEVAAAVMRLLQWLTDDVWEIEFVAGRDRRRWAETQSPLFADPPSAPAHFGLFSGGLDSFLGAEHDLRQGEGELVLISAAPSQNMRVLQRRAVTALADLGPRRLRSIIVPMGVRGSAVTAVASGSRETPEPSQRTRAFVFLVLGSVAAATGGGRELRVYENGVGAMNLPLTEAQFGSHNTRAMRPETLLLAGRLMSLVVEAAFSIFNPSFSLTKVQLCERARAEAREIALCTVSCDTALTHRTSRTHLCGTCTSCLLRRQALRAGGMLDYDRRETAEYRCDVLDLAHGDAGLQRLHYMLSQAAQLEAALAEPAPALADEFPDLRSIHQALAPLGYRDPTELTNSLLSRYVDEWRAFGHPLVDRYLGGLQLRQAA